jgi:hypothetical protein
MKYKKVIFIPVAAIIFWLFAGKTFCHLVDYVFVSSKKLDISSIQFSPTGLTINELALDSNGENVFSLDSNGYLVFNNSGNSFSLGTARELSYSEENWKVYLLTPDSSDQVSLEESHSLFFWKEPFKMNFMTGHTADRYRFRYYTLRWQKASGTSLTIDWRYEQNFNAGMGWSRGNSVPNSKYTYGITSLKVTSTPLRK